VGAKDKNVMRGASRSGNALDCPASMFISLLFMGAIAARVLVILELSVATGVYVMTRQELKTERIGRSGVLACEGRESKQNSAFGGGNFRKW